MTKTVSSYTFFFWKNNVYLLQKEVPKKVTLFPHFPYSLHSPSLFFFSFFLPASQELSYRKTKYK